MTSTLAYIPSPSQGVWHLGPIPIRAYALLIIAGIIVALVLGDRRWEQRGGERGVIYDIALWAVPFGLLGGRLYHVMTDWETYFGEGGAGLWAAAKVWGGGLGIWGAVALGGVGAWIGCRRRGIPLPAFGDAIAPGIVLAQAIGRLGNYFNQELYGRPTTMPWGLEIFERVDANGLPDSLNGVATGPPISVVHPTFLYELLWNVLVFGVLIWADRRFKLGHGRLFALYVACYCVGRFGVELMRSDTATLIAGIRVNSFTSTFVFIGAVVYIMVAPKGREDPSSLRGKEEENGEKDTAVEEFVKELTAVAAATGPVAAAKVAGQAEREDAEAVGDVDGSAKPDDQPPVGAEALLPDATEAETESFTANESEPFEQDTADPPGPDAADASAEPDAADGAEPESEAAAEASELADEVAEAPSEQIVEAAEFAESVEQAEVTDEAPSVEDEAALDPVAGTSAEPDASDGVPRETGAAAEVSAEDVEGAEAAEVSDEVPGAEAEAEAVPAEDEAALEPVGDASAEPEADVDGEAAQQSEASTGSDGAPSAEAEADPAPAEDEAAPEPVADASAEPEAADGLPSGTGAAAEVSAEDVEAAEGAGLSDEVPSAEAEAEAVPVEDEAALEPVADASAEPEADLDGGAAEAAEVSDEVPGAEAEAALVEDEAALEPMGDSPAEPEAEEPEENIEAPETSAAEVEPTPAGVKAPEPQSMPAVSRSSGRRTQPALQQRLAQVDELAGRVRGWLRQRRR